MFAVPGWKVSASSLTSDRSTRNPKATHDTNAIRGDTNGRKRKHDHGGSRNPNGFGDGDLDRLWKRYVEGDGKEGKPPKAKGDLKQERREGKRRIVEESVPKNAALPSELDNVLEATPEATKKEARNKQKREQRPAKETGQGELKESTRAQLKPKPKTDIDMLKRSSVVANPTTALQPTSLPPPPPPASNLTPLQQSMRHKLLSARFRHLNETLYTTPSTAALALFTASPDLFDEYHAGFSQQVKELWPENPVDGYIRAIKTRAKVKPAKKERYRKPGTPIPNIDALPRRPNGSCTVIDLGCGDAALSRALQPVLKSLSLRVLSYDLHAANELITKADVAALPLRDGEADVAIFCLSLMGTNWIAFVEEAWRALRGDSKGELWVSEVKSRFGRVTKKGGGIGQQKRKPKSRNARNDDDEEGLDQEVFAEDEAKPQKDDNETDISAFVNVFQRRGFQLKPESVEKSNKMFLRMVFVKTGIPTAGKWAGQKWIGRDNQPPQRSHNGIKKFVERDRSDNGPTVEEETRVLKPCVYKIR